MSAFIHLYRQGSSLYMPPHEQVRLMADYRLTRSQLAGLARLVADSVKREDCSPRGYSAAVRKRLEEGLRSGTLSRDSVDYDEDAQRLAYTLSLLAPHRAFIRPDNGLPQGAGD